MTLARSLWIAGLVTPALASCQGGVVTRAGGATSTGATAASSTTTSAGPASSSATSSTSSSATSSTSSSTSSGAGAGGGPGCDPGTAYVEVDGDGAPQHFGGSCAPAATLTIALGSTTWVLDTCGQGASDPLTIAFSSTAEWGAVPPWASVSTQFDYVKGGAHWTGTGVLSVPTFNCPAAANAPPPPGPYYFSGTFTATVAPPSADAGAPVTITGSFCVPATCTSSLPG